jgi:hypothetical protein
MMRVPQLLLRCPQFVSPIWNILAEILQPEKYYNLKTSVIAQTMQIPNNAYASIVTNKAGKLIYR